MVTFCCIHMPMSKIDHLLTFRQVSIHNPDKAIAVISAAGWLSKEDYGDSNVFYRHDISVSHTDPIIKAIQESCVVENQADKHASNLKVRNIY